MLDGLMLIDAHLHPARLPTLKPAWLDWARRCGQPGWEGVYDADGTIIPQAFDDLMESEGSTTPLLLCEYSPKVTPASRLLPRSCCRSIKQNPARFAFLANVNPHLHYPVTGELARQLALGAVGLKGAPRCTAVQRGRPDALSRLPGLRRGGPAGGGALRHQLVPGLGQLAGRAGPPAPGAARLPRADHRARARRARLVVRRRGVRWPCCTRTCGSTCPGCRRTGRRTTARAFDLRRLQRASSSSRPTGPACPASARNARAVAALDLGDDVAGAAVLAGTPGPSTQG